MIIKAERTKLTVLQVATLNQPVKQDLGYSPIETVIYNIDKGLCLLGHRSIVACSGDSIVVGEKYITIKQSFNEYCSKDTLQQRESMHTHFIMSLERARESDINIIHVHDALMAEYIYKGVFKSPVPIVMSLHVPAEDRSSFKCWHQSLASSSQMYFVPISEYQKMEYPNLVNVGNVIHHGIDLENYPVKKNLDKGTYLFIIGRITKVKGQDKAIEVAKKTGSKLIIAGCVQNKAADKEFFIQLKDSIDLLLDVGKYPVDKDYYAKVIKPLLDCDKQIIYIGEINSEQKKLWYQHAKATLFPIQWGEPFGLVLIESMACGTPILAFEEGAVPEIVLHGKTGFVVNSLAAMIEAVELIDNIDPYECRRHVQNNFSITSMAQKYSELYQWIFDDNKIIDNRGQGIDFTLTPESKGIYA
ncbi:MAG: hypothetical protein DRP78_00500 [Candidatus Omnitrophota bacterium]|nr:MAG: hypothetical protein DRP78_00500 [Candidatus Omnitrophota bacterium]